MLMKPTISPSRRTTRHRKSSATASASAGKKPGGSVTGRTAALRSTSRKSACSSVGVTGDVVEALDDAPGLGEVLLDPPGGVLVLGVQARQIVVVSAPRRRQRQHHVGIGLYRPVPEAAQCRGLLHLGRRQVLDEREVRLAREPLGPAHPVDGLGDAWPDRFRCLARSEADRVRAPGQQVPAHQHPLAYRLAGPANRRGQRPPQAAALGRRPALSRRAAETVATCMTTAATGSRPLKISA